jgi:twitching motility protein PilT
LLDRAPQTRRHRPDDQDDGFAANLREIAKEKTGLVLLTGATGSGKTTTLAALLNEINETQPVHIVTLEDPIEFVHPKRKATFNQRELGHDFNNYPERPPRSAPPGAESHPRR